MESRLKNTISKTAVIKEVIGILPRKDPLIREINSSS